MKSEDKKENSQVFISFLPLLAAMAITVVSVFDGSFSVRKSFIQLISGFAISLLVYAVLRGISNYREHGRL